MAAEQYLELVAPIWVSEREDFCVILAQFVPSSRKVEFSRSILTNKIVIIKSLLLLNLIVVCPRISLYDPMWYTDKTVFSDHDQYWLTS